MYGRNTRGLPGTLAPMYQDAAFGNSVIRAPSSTCTPQPSSAISVGSIVVEPSLRSCVKQSAIQSTCCSIDTIMFDSTDGLPGPVIVNRFGKPTDIKPRYVRGPCAHFCLSDSPSRPVMSTDTIAPVIASKPVANTI